MNHWLRTSIIAAIGTAVISTAALAAGGQQPSGASKSTPGAGTPPASAGPTSTSPSSTPSTPASTSAPATPQAATQVYIPPPANAPPVVPAGSALYVRLTTTLTDKTNNTGDPFTGEVTKPITANGTEIISAGSMVNGHVAFIKPSGRFKGKAEMRLVLDSIITPDDVTYRLAAGLEEAKGGACAGMKNDDEGTIQGCGKSKKDAMKDAGIAGAMGAGAGATVGLGHEIDCNYYGNCGGPGMGADIGYGAAIGAGTALIYHFIQHEKHIILVEGTALTFMVNRTSSADAQPVSQTAAKE